MALRLSQVILRLIILLSLATTPATAAQMWECKFTSKSGSGKGFESHAKASVVGDKFLWQIQIAKIALSPSAGMKWITFPGHVIENNDVGVVGISSESRIDQDVGPTVGARVTVIQKSNGKLRVGTVMALGVYELASGNCRRSQ